MSAAKSCLVKVQNSSLFESDSNSTEPKPQLMDFLKTKLLWSF